MYAIRKKVEYKIIHDGSPRNAWIWFTYTVQWFVCLENEKEKEYQSKLVTRLMSLSKACIYVPYLERFLPPYCTMWSITERDFGRCTRMLCHTILHSVICFVPHTSPPSTAVILCDLKSFEGVPRPSYKVIVCENSMPKYI